MSIELRENASRGIWLGMMPTHGMAGLYAAPETPFWNSEYFSDCVIMRCSKQ
jgi:hypothetical protein